MAIRSLRAWPKLLADVKNIDDREHAFSKLVFQRMVIERMKETE